MSSLDTNNESPKKVISTTASLVNDLSFLAQAEDVERKTLENLEKSGGTGVSDTANRIAAIRETLAEHSGLREITQQVSLALAAQNQQQARATGPGGSSTSGPATDTTPTPTRGGRFLNG